MGLTEVPSELFRMKNLQELHLSDNNLCSLPSEIAHLATLVVLQVRFSKRSDRDLTKSHYVSGQWQPFHVSSARARSADQAQDTLRAAIEADGS
jgi:Leucine-rich repeat (LRR) protein